MYLMFETIQQPLLASLWFGPEFLKLFSLFNQLFLCDESINIPTAP